MAVSPRLSLIFSVLVSLLSLGEIVQAATFSFSTGSLPISEGRNLSEMLSIIKTGDNVNTITFRVIVMSGTAEENTDYIPNRDYNYVFTRDTRSLPIQTQLVADRAGEGIENFRICLPTQMQFDALGQGAMVGSPDCVDITIIDDDSVVIGFQDGSTSVSITEGDPPQMICAEVKDFGLELDPFDSVPLNLRTVPAGGSGVMLGTDTFTFRAANIVRCTTVSIAVNNEVDGTRTIRVMLAEQTPTTTTVPTELYPVSSQVTISDDERDVIRFSFDTQAALRSYNLMEGEILSSISIMKEGDTSLNFMVTPLVVPTITSSLAGISVTVTGAQFAPSASEGNIALVALEIEDRKQFNLSINDSGISADNGVDSVSGFYVSTGRDQIQITVYDNDFEVGFTQDTVPYSNEVCVKIFNPRDVHPNTYISLSITVKNSTSPTGVALGMNDVTLNATDTMVCTSVEFDDNTCRVATLELFRTNDNANSIRFRRNSTAITCRSTDSAAVTVGVTVSFVLVGILLAIIIIIAFVLFCKRKVTRLKYSNSSTRTSSDENISTLLDDKHAIGLTESAQCQTDKFPLGEEQPTTQPPLHSNGHALPADISAPGEAQHTDPHPPPYSATPGVGMTQPAQSPTDKYAPRQIAQPPPYSTRTVPLQPVEPVLGESRPIAQSTANVIAWQHRANNSELGQHRLTAHHNTSVAGKFDTDSI